MIRPGTATLSRSAISIQLRLHCNTSEGHTKVISCARDLHYFTSASTPIQAIIELRTSGSNSVLFHSLPLAIEGIVLGTLKYGALGAGKSSLEGGTHSWQPGLGSKAL